MFCQIRINHNNNDALLLPGQNSVISNVAQNVSSRLKRAIESRTQQHTMSQFSSLEENGVICIRNQF